jgi:hypothetical protein
MNEYTDNPFWDEFVDFAYAKRFEHELLYPAPIEKSVFAQMLAFHFHNKNLYVTRAPDGWAFSVVRPVRSAWDFDFDWKQPQTSLYFLELLYSKCKLATARLWSQLYDNGVRATGMFYLRRGNVRALTPRLLHKLFFEISRKEN